MGLNTEDRWIIASLSLSFIGVASAALFKDPRPIGISVFVIVPLLILAWHQTRSARLGWLLIFGAAAGFGELWADWIHVEYFRFAGVSKLFWIQTAGFTFIYAIRLVAHCCAIRILRVKTRGAMAEQYCDPDHHRDGNGIASLV